MAVEAVHLSGFRELRRALAVAGNGLQPELRDGLKRAGDVVIRDARGHIPVLTGRARGSLRVVSRGARIEAVGGKGSVPYYPWLEFGGSVSKGRVVRPRAPGGRYLYPAVERNTSRLAAEAELALDRVLKRAGFA